MAIIFGLAGFTALMFVAVPRFSQTRADRFFLSIAFYSVLNSAVTTVSRGVYGIDGALQNRYIPTSTLFWVGLVGVLLPRGIQILRNPCCRLRQKGVVCSFAALLLAMICVANWTGYRWLRVFYDRSLEAGQLFRGGEHPEMLRLRLTYSKNLGPIRKQEEILKKYRLSVFA